ncbi:MAG: leucine-rich repeat domain-containing protein [Spirochaetaceae bacterium]|nr:leucine-rich repeat domain-containing protein [Spirochaetaceae bacterium]
MDKPPPVLNRCKLDGGALCPEESAKWAYLGLEISGINGMKEMRVLGPEEYSIVELTDAELPEAADPKTDKVTVNVKYNDTHRYADVRTAFTVTVIDGGFEIAWYQDDKGFVYADPAIISETGFQSGSVSVTMHIVPAAGYVYDPGSLAYLGSNTPPPPYNSLVLGDGDKVSINIGCFGSGRKIKLYADFVPDLTTRGGIIEYLDQQPNGALIRLDIGTGYEGTWEDLLDAIDFACSRESKTVALDLSATTDGVFDPRNDKNFEATNNQPYPYNTGEPYIVELVLPEAATKIADRGFTSEGGDDPLGGRNKGAFEGFTALVKVSAVSVETIGRSAFFSCKALETANFRAVETIQSYAFYQCTALTSLTLPAVPPELGDAVFRDTYDATNSDSTLYIHVGSEDAVKEYESGEFHSAVANQDPDQVDKYGPNHKRIVITSSP